MHDDVMLSGVFRICLWLVARHLWIPNREKERFIRDLSEISRGGEGGGNRGSQLFDTAEKGGVVKKWVMQIYVRDHVEVHPQKKKEVLYFVQNTWGNHSRPQSHWA